MFREKKMPFALLRRVTKMGTDPVSGVAIPTNAAIPLMMPGHERKNHLSKKPLAFFALM
jgi:hypothetical protein